MNSQKCPNCGLVNFADVSACKRCNYTLQSSLNQSNNQFINSSNQNNFNKGNKTTYSNQPAYSAESYKGSKCEPSPNSDKYFKKMIFGALWAIGGTVVTVLSYSSASSGGGGRYFIFWGAIIFGVIDFLVGLSGWVSNKN